MTSGKQLNTLCPLQHFVRETASVARLGMAPPRRRSPTPTNPTFETT